MNKTVVVVVDRVVSHPLYKKVMRTSKKYKAHDEGNVCQVGDKVQIMETRPMSASKNWVVLEVLAKGKDRIEEEDKGMPAPIRKAKEENDTK
jgi:small subunit ribosomal protein S17